MCHVRVGLLENIVMGMLYSILIGSAMVNIGSEILIGRETIVEIVGAGSLGCFLVLCPLLGSRMAKCP